jgi:hypothetical protein
MVYTFQFFIDNHLHFQKNLRGFRCIGRRRDGHQCGRTSVIGCPYCFQHLRSERHLRVRPSTIPNAGKGLFAEDPLRADREIIFRVGDYIIDYTGESINENQLEERYGEYTGPYAIEVRGRSNQRGGLFIDAAAERGVGSLINHRARSSANSVFVVDYRANRARLRAVRPIRNGDEIFVSYGNQYQMNEPGASSRTKGLR